jgi:PAS domain S-box-containing protein
MVSKKHYDLGENTVITRDGIVFVTLRGKQGAALAQQTLAAFKQAVSDIQQKGQRVFVLVDYRALSVQDVTSEARIAIKEAFGEPYIALAAVGKSKLTEVAMYLMKAGDSKNRSQFFTSYEKGVRWLQQYDTPKPKRSSLLLIGAIVAHLVGWMALIGWAIDNRYLMGFLADLRPMNPMGAVGLIILSIAMLSIWTNRRTISLFAASSVIALGIAALLPLDIDHLLFAQKVRDIGWHTQLADSAAICFIACGISIIAIHSKLTTRPARAARGILCGIVIAIALFNLFGILYARDILYGISPTFTMAFNLAFGLALAGAGLLGLLIYDRHGNILGRVSRTGWLIICSLLLVQIATYTSWQQSIQRNKADAMRAFDLRSKELEGEIQSRVNAYIDGLYGLRGLYAASDGVSEGEFNAYYDTVKLAEKYPGIRALSFISRVPETDLPAFINERKRDTSRSPAGNPEFTIKQKSSGSIHYILTYYSNAPDTTAYGIDFADDAVRKATYETAMQSGKPAVSDTISFAATATRPASRGFFITIPLQDHTGTTTADGKKYIGFVSAVFGYDEFFANAVASSDLLKDVDVTIADTRSTAELFSSDRVKGNTTQLAYGSRIQVADRTWTISVKGLGSFGNSESQMNLPAVVLAGGQAISLLLAGIFFIQSRARDRALRLADDITADLQRERNEAVAIRQKDDAILSSIGDAVFAVDTDGVITLFNPAAAHISGFSAREAIGQHYETILHFEFQQGDHAGAINNAFIKKALTGTLASMENHTVIVRKDGKTVPVADSAAPIRDLHGNINGVIVVFRDVSKEYELDRAKTEFVSLASHQLRTPLSAINWYAEMLLNGDAGKITDDQKTYLDEIYQGNQRMVELVNSLLDVSRLDLGKLTNTPVENNIRDLIDSLEKEMTTTVKSKQLDLKTTVAPDLPSVVADPKLLRMIVQNLLSNAIKYTDPKGSVTVTATTAAPEYISGANLPAGQKYLYFSVADTGYGIPQEQQSKIFGKLFRADNVRALDVEGTGLGLYIVKEVVEKLGGRTWFDSVEGKGSTFYVVLPFKTKQSK